MTSAGSAAPETITLVQDARGRPLTKSFRRRGAQIIKSNYPNAAEFRALVVEVDGISCLAEVLDAVVTDGHAAVIRGAPGRFYPQNGQPAFRLLHPQEGLASAKTGARISQQQIRRHNLEPDGVHRYAVTWLPTFEDRPRSWVIFDVDRIPVPDHLTDDWVDEPDAAVEHVLGLLPEPFRARDVLVVDQQLCRDPWPARARGRERVQAQAGILARPAAARHRDQAVDGRREGAGRSRRVRRGPADLSRSPRASVPDCMIPSRADPACGRARTTPSRCPELLPEPDAAT